MNEMKFEDEDSVDDVVEMSGNSIDGKFFGWKI
jgi:hypothetical protein